MTDSPGTGTGWPRGRKQWIVGAIVLVAAGAIVGQLLGNLVVGLLIAALVSIGWLMAYESWRGRNVGMRKHSNDPFDDSDDDGARL
jgi:hypothetical protein